MSRPMIVFFQEILEGDLKKQQARSNTTQSGGGARDLRIPSTFATYLHNFFSEELEGKRIATVCWSDENGQPQTTDLELWPPTDARPRELRIATIHNIDAWRIASGDENEFQEDLKNGKKWFYLLVKTDTNSIGANILKYAHLEEAEVTIKLAIKKRIEETTRGSARGVFFYTDGKVYP